MSTIEGRNIDHNLKRKVENKELPKRKEFRIKDTNTMLKFLAINKELDNRTGKHGTQSTMQAIMDLAWEKLNEIEKKDQELQKIFES